MPRQPRLPAVAVVDAASVTVAASRCSEARRSLYSAKHTRAHPTITGGHSCAVTGICPANRATYLASIEYAVVFRDVCRPERLLPPTLAQPRPQRMRRRRQRRQATAVAAAGAAADERVSIVFMFVTILANAPPPLGRTLGAPFFTTGV